jgi:hypothetical protein
MKISLSVLAFFGIVFVNFAAQVEKPQPTKAIRVETQILKSIVFITENVKIGDKTETLGGTGFLYAVPDSRLGPNKSFFYLVTNRHVADAMEEDEQGNCKNAQILQTFVWLNLKEPVSGTRSEKIPIVFNQTSHWYYPHDGGVDLAVMPISISDRFDVREILPENLLTEQILEDRVVVPGDKVLTTGFFTGYAGLHAIQPLVREGVLAMMPDGPMMSTTCKSAKVYLADVHVIPGNSGSPIFIVPGMGLGASVTISGVPSTFGLLGIVSGYMYETSDFTLRPATTWKGSLNANSGISMIVPAQQLKDLIDTEELQNLREETVRHRSGSS